MIWDDPWTLVAMTPEGTRLPPPRTPLAGLRFVCEQVADLDLEIWNELVGSRWTPAELRQRLADAWIPCLFLGADLVATCVLRPKPDMWILETLRSRKGYGTALMRAAIPWIYDFGGVFTLAYTWELSLPGLAGAWWRGWLGSATTLQYGWHWSADCGFCPQGWTPIGERITLPSLIGSAVVSDSGLGDGWGYVLAYTGEPDWAAVAKKGGWRSLWMRATTAPKGWTWTGECIVVGFLNYAGQSVDWITAEISFS